MSGIAIYLYLHKRLKHPAAAEQVVISDAAFVEPAPDAAIAVAVTPDAGVRTTRRDAGAVASISIDAAVRAPADAGVRVAQVADAGVAADPAQRLKDARALRDLAHAALEDGDPDKALKLADQSLALHKTALAYIDRGRAQQRLGQVDDALKSIDEALALVVDYAPAWEQRGMILWAARRRDEARPALERYLELDPHGKDADSIRQMLNNAP